MKTHYKSASEPTSDNALDLSTLDHDQFGVLCNVIAKALSDGILQAVAANASNFQPKAWMDTDEAAEYCGGMSAKYLELLRTKGGGPKYTKLDRLVRYRKDELDKWLLSHQTDHTNR